MQNERHSSQELSEDEFSGGFGCGGADEAEAKLGEESTASAGSERRKRQRLSWHKRKEIITRKILPKPSPTSRGSGECHHRRGPVKLKLGDSGSDVVHCIYKKWKRQIHSSLLPKAHRSKNSQQCHHLHSSSMNLLSKAAVTTLTVKTIGAQVISKCYFFLKALPERNSDVRWSSSIRRVRWICSQDSKRACCRERIAHQKVSSCFDERRCWRSK